ncbi:uncharacterized protein LOC129918196 [Episyrphus balteatus]|uniref:uncharacterized protein LOC129918196 n=1 Tax=Episyrphus balteatus TaxID=286459 RepID=UPI0024861CCC|nr:uncharacterized protein LOC129918196 [Episyrphus balteatus]
MAKKGGAQQLQAEINTDEELYKFLERPGVLVLDVYAEWCGPCLAMVGSLRKIKLELGGDNLHLAVCKSDTIEALKRFRNKSEPTWLFACQRKCVNLMFGTDVPRLMKLISDELNNIGNTKRTFYDITELQPEEQARRDVIEKAAAEALRKEVEEAKREKLEYLTFVTDEIMKNLPDMGVTIFGPHVSRDVYKKLMEVAETQKMQCKDRRTGPLLPEHFDIINFACENPIDPEVLENMYNKDLLICFWKISETDTRELQDIFITYSNELTQTRKVVLDTGEIDPDQVLPPILNPLEIKIAKKFDGLPEKEKPAIVVDKAEFDDPLAEILGDEPLPGEEVEGNEETEAQEDNTKKPEETGSVASSSDAQIILIPPVWVPTDARTHATLIYVFFRAQTSTFLPPDPVPDPPHIVMAFDAYKKKDIFEIVEKNKENVLLYGFFTNDNPETAELIANSLTKYEAKTPQITDKLVLKVAKTTSHTMLAFAEYGPSYVSANTVVGKQEALKLFPEGYVNVEVVEEEEPEVGEEITKKKKKSKAKLVDGAEAENEADVSTPEGEGNENSEESPRQQANEEN